MFDSNQFFGGGGAGDFYPVSIDQSLRFNDDDGAYLSRTHTLGNRKTWTWSGWVKIGNVSANSTIFSGGSTTGRVALYKSSGGNLITDLGGTGAYDQSVAVFRDPSAWYHLVWRFDTTDATGANRSRIWINGEEITLTKTRTWSIDTDYAINSAALHTMGVFSNSIGTYHLDGYMAEVNFIDGTAYDETAFGEFKSGVWVAKAPSVDYGTNGFHLDFANSADIGNDVSGEGNDWTPNNFTASDVVLDSPTDNFATWNPLNLGGGTLSDGNLRWVASNSIGLLCTATMAFDVESTTNKYYWEVTVSSGEMVIGIAPTTLRGSDTGRAGSYGYYGNPGSKFSGTSSSSYGANFGSGDVIGVAVGDGKITFYKNGVSQGDAFTGLTGIFVPFIAEVTCDITANFGQSGFTYTPPTGYLALSTANLPDPVIDPAQGSSPEDYFDVGIWTGDGINGRNIADLYGHTPDWVWIKNRSAAIDHNVADVLRGWKELYPNLTNAEGSQQMNAPTNDGLSGLPASNGYNNNGDAYVSWGWKANGSGVSNTDGSITSMVSANTKAGFSIVGYQGTLADANIGHGLDSAPEMIIIKNRNRSAGTPWVVYHSALSGAPDNRLHLNDTAVFTSAGNIFGSTPTAPNADVFYVGNVNWVNNNVSGENDHIAYCFHSVEGFSKFGSYEGGSDAFVYTGFRPAMIICKNIDSGTAKWGIKDNARSPYNPTRDSLYPNSNIAAYTGTLHDVDFLSNGFKLRNADDVWDGSGTYIFMAFAENPFKYSNAR